MMNEETVIQRIKIEKEISNILSQQQLRRYVNQ